MRARLYGAFFSTDAVIALQQANDLDYALRLVKAHILPYYQANGLMWCDTHFHQAWTSSLNHEIIYLPAHQRVGIARIIAGENCFYLKDLHIEKQHQNKGIGKQYLTSLITQAKTLNYQAIKLRVFIGNPAIHLYTRMGFVALPQEASGLIKMIHTIKTQP